MRVNVTLEVSPIDTDDDELEAFAASLKSTLEEQFSADPTVNYETDNGDFNYEITESRVIVSDE